MSFAKQIFFLTQLDFLIFIFLSAARLVSFFRKVDKQEFPTNLVRRMNIFMVNKSYISSQKMIWDMFVQPFQSSSGAYFALKSHWIPAHLPYPTHKFYSK